MLHRKRTAFICGMRPFLKAMHADPFRNDGTYLICVSFLGVLLKSSYRMWF